MISDIARKKNITDDLGEMDRLAAEGKLEECSMVGDLHTYDSV